MVWVSPPLADSLALVKGGPFTKCFLSFHLLFFILESAWGGGETSGKGNEEGVPVTFPESGCLVPSKSLNSRAC